MYFRNYLISNGADFCRTTTIKQKNLNIAPAIAEIASIYEELLSIFKLKTSFSLVKGDSESPLSLSDLMGLEELKDANLKVTIYSTDGQLLADMIVTGEMVDSETVIDAGEQIEESAEDVTKTVEQQTAAKIEKPKAPLKAQKGKIMAKKSAEHKTVKGAKLPKTASNP
ncbi:processed acidic surface protein [Bacillus songklensis]|uniref:Processed acidic surface protein n=1 Tax=Bacillus songklensis TaxID=1069116 RepID=A0ABV8B9C2_9BACI